MNNKDFQPQQMNIYHKDFQPQQMNICRKNCFPAYGNTDKEISPARNWRGKRVFSSAMAGIVLHITETRNLLSALSQDTLSLPRPAA